MTTIDVTTIDACLPQTQCQQCDYPRCLDYAEAILFGEANINQCPPGGDTTIKALADLLDQDPVTLNPKHGETEVKKLAWIDESKCIGCKLCIKACPVDAIVGSIKLMHTVIVDECTGCKLCLPVCPTDCIQLTEMSSGFENTEEHRWPGYSPAQVEKARVRTQQKLDRQKINENLKRDALAKRKKLSLQKKIMAAVERKQSSQQSQFKRYGWKKD